MRVDRHVYFCKFSSRVISYLELKQVYIFKMRNFCFFLFIFVDFIAANAQPAFNCDASLTALSVMWVQLESNYGLPNSPLYSKLVETIEETVYNRCWIGKSVDSLVLQLGRPSRVIYQNMDPESGVGNFYYYLDSAFEQNRIGCYLVFKFEDSRVTWANLVCFPPPPPERIFPAIDSGVIFLEPLHFRDSLTAIVKVNHPSVLSLVFYRDKEQPTYQAMMHEVFNELEATRWSLPIYTLEELEPGIWWVLVIQHGGKREEARQWVQLEKQE